MQKKLEEIFTPQVVDYYKQNKDQITCELLDELRAFGNDGKQRALDILDFAKDSEQYYLDAYGNRMSFDGNRRLKKSFNKLALSPIHKDELLKCSQDIHYFKDNYIKIKTKSGVNFPDMRQYQNEFLDILVGESEDIIGLLPRQGAKTSTVSIFLAYCFLFKRDLNIGITANRGTQAEEFLNTTKNILIELPIWMQVGLQTWNVRRIVGENQMRILTDVPTSDSFRGFTISILVCDETAFIKSSKWDVFSDSIFPSQSALAWKKNIIISTMNGVNFFSQMVEKARKKYIDNINKNDSIRMNDGTVLTIQEYYKKKNNLSL